MEAKYKIIGLGMVLAFALGTSWVFNDPGYLWLTLLVLLITGGNRP